ncbi:MAG: hypothetical protein ACLU8J_02680 [Acutalibacter sp.]
MNYTTAQSPRREKNALRLELRRRLGLPRYTLGEEIFSAVSHGVSALYAVGPWCGCFSPAGPRRCGWCRRRCSGAPWCCCTPCPPCTTAWG